MAGRSGVGRRTSVMLVAHMHQINVITPKIGRGYGIKQFKNDLKTVSLIYKASENKIIAQLELFENEVGPGVFQFSVQQTSMLEECQRQQA